MVATTEKQVELSFRRGLAQLGVNGEEQALAKLVHYCLELTKWNRKVNLIAKNTPLEDIIEKHFLDSLTLVPVLDKLKLQNTTLLDVGSGAGFPGLVLKIVRPDWTITLLEPRKRRVTFLQHIIRQLGLDTITVADSRIEQGGLPEKNYGIITGRAVASVAQFLDMVSAFASPETHVVCMQGVSGIKGLQEGDRIEKFVCREIVETSLPFCRNKRFILLFGKIA